MVLAVVDMVCNVERELLDRFQPELSPKHLVTAGASTTPQAWDLAEAPSSRLMSDCSVQSVIEPVVFGRSDFHHAEPWSGYVRDMP